MESPPRSKWSIVPRAVLLALAQQLLYFAITAALAPAPDADSERNWGVAAAFIIGGTALNAVFYCAAWLGFLSAAQISSRWRPIYTAGLVGAVFFFTLACFLAAHIDPKGPFGSYAQMAVLVITIASGFKVDDARDALGPPPSAKE